MTISSPQSNCTIHLLGATDRNNFGDLLFPIILKHYLSDIQDTHEVKNFSFLRSDLSEHGALPTQSYRSLIKSLLNQENPVVICVGGTLLGADWEGFLRFSSPLYDRLSNIRIFRKLVTRINLARRLVSPIALFRPFILNHPSLEHVRVIYNAVGGITTSHHGLTQASMGNGGPFWTNSVNRLKSNNTLLSVRDHEAEKVLNLNSIPCRLVPDSAVLASEVFNADLVHKHLSHEAKTAIGDGDYFVLQISGDPRKQPECLDHFARAISKAAEANQIRVLLMPIGLAAGHDDHVPLQKIKKNSPVFDYFEPSSIYDTLGILMNCQFFLGTSLHGFLITHVFGKPSFYFREILKVRNYAESWIPNLDLSVSLADPGEVFDKFTSYPMPLHLQDLQKQQSAAREWLVSIKDWLAAVVKSQDVNSHEK